MRAPEALILKVEDAHLAAIGRVANEWALMEVMADMEIWRLARIDPEVGVCITSQFLSLNRRIYALVALLRLKEGDAAASLIDILNKQSRRLDRLAQKRNRVVHDVWAYGVRSGRHYRREATAERALSFSFVAESKDDLLALAEEIVAERQKFRAAIQGYEDAKPKGTGKLWKPRASRGKPSGASPE